LEPTTGVTPSTPVEIRADQLPIRLTFQGRRYILRKTSNGKLIMTGDFR
jgi:hemin uptake protein HemP